MATAVKTATSTQSDDAQADVSAQLAALKEDLSGLTSAMTALSKAQARALGERAADVSHKMTAMGRDAGERMNAQAHDMYDQTNDFIVRQPAAAVGIAAGVGFLVGLLTARR